MFILRRLGLAFGLLVAVLASQLPEFAQQYRQRVGGALDELQRILSDFDRDAASRNLTRAQGIERLNADPDPFVAQRGRRMRETEVRADRLDRQLTGFREAGSFHRLFVLTRDFDPSVARRAYEAFEPAVPVTSEGLVAAAVGGVAGYSLWSFLMWPFERRHRRRVNLPPRSRPLNRPQ